MQKRVTVLFIYTGFSHLKPIWGLVWNPSRKGDHSSTKEWRWRRVIL